MSSSVVIHTCSEESWKTMSSKNSLSLTNIFMTLYDTDDLSVFAYKLLLFQNSNSSLLIHIYYKTNESIHNFLNSLASYNFMSVSKCCCNYNADIFYDVVHKVTDYVLTVPDSISSIWTKNEQDFEVIVLPKKRNNRRKRNKKNIFK